MYKEIIRFARHILTQKSLWKDGELWTAFFFSIVSFFYFYHDQSIIAKIRGHFNDLLTVTSIIFGFIFTALIFYVQAAGTWADDEKIQKVSHKIIDWHVWTIINLIFLIAYIIILWCLGHLALKNVFWNAILYAVLIFLTLYIIFQILNHILTVWWVFKNKDRLKKQQKDNSK